MRPTHSEGLTPLGAHSPVQRRSRVRPVGLRQVKIPDPRAKCGHVDDQDVDKHEVRPVLSLLDPGACSASEEDEAADDVEDVEAEAVESTSSQTEGVGVPRAERRQPEVEGESGEDEEHDSGLTQRLPHAKQLRLG